MNIKYNINNRQLFDPACLEITDFHDKKEGQEWATQGYTKRVDVLSTLQEVSISCPLLRSIARDCWSYTWDLLGDTQKKATPWC